MSPILNAALAVLAFVAVMYLIVGMIAVVLIVVRLWRVR